VPKLSRLMYSYIPIYHGSLEIIFTDEYLYGVGYLHGRVVDRRLDHYIVSLFEDYVYGKRVTFSDIELAPGRGTIFDYRVWSIAREIPYGEVRSYGWIAERLGGRRYSRAVARSLSRNPFLIVVPCHRVVYSSGGIGGFSSEGGVGLKSFLLELEGIRL